MSWSSPTARRSRASCSERRGVATGEVDLQHRVDRLPGDRQRPELRRADHHVHQPAHRQLRRQPAPTSSRAGCSAAASSFVSWPGARATVAREGDFDTMLRRYGVPGITGIDTRRLTRLIRDTGALPGAFGPAERHRRRRPRRRRRARHRRPRPRRHRHHDRARTRSATARRAGASSPTTSASSARSCATSPTLGTVEVVPAATPAADALALRARRHLPLQRSRRPGLRRRRRRHHRRPARHAACRCSASASATSCSARRSAASHGEAAVRPPRRQPPGAATSTTGAIEITSQNHNFAVAPDGLGGVATMTHVNLNDGVCEGLQATEANAFSVQHHPEAGPGPHDSRYLFARFAERMIGHRARRSARRRHRAARRRRAAPEPSGLPARRWVSPACRAATTSRRSSSSARGRS